MPSDLLELDLLLLAGVDEADRSAPICSANSSICSSLSDCVAVTISPSCMRKRTTSAAVRFSLGPSSCGVELRSMTTSPSGTGASDGGVGGEVHRLELLAAPTPATTLATGRALLRAAAAAGATAAGTTARTATGAAGPPPGPPPGRLP